MVRELVDYEKIEKKVIPDIVYVIFSFIGSIISFIIFCFLVLFYNFSDVQILVKSDSRLAMSYQDKIDYYYIYDKINFCFLNKTLYLKNDMFSKREIKSGRNIINDYELIVSDEYSFLLNKKILININNKLHEFFIVGTYEATNIIDMKNVYTSGETLEGLYNYSNNNFYYIFIISDYHKLNENLDFFSSLGHDVEIITTNMFDDLYSYAIVKDLFMLLSIMFLFIYLVYIF